MHRGSRKHVLDWTSQDGWLSELVDLLSPCPVEIDSGARWMPGGYERPDEARLEIFGPEWMPGHPAWDDLADWWLVHKRRANTPNWDIAVGCIIENRPGLILVEAKANWPELGTGGKPLSDRASENSQENHAQIGCAIEEANVGWQQIDSRVNISRDSHYQLANRLAFTWKLGMLGFAVALLYLGFTGDEGIRNVGSPFEDEDDWNHAFLAYAEGTVPLDLFERRIDLGPAPVWLTSRSRPVLEVSPTPP